LQFDEVVVFSDTSDVFDEATRYFCIDEDPEYRKYCLPESGDDWYDAGTSLARHFVVTDSLRMIIKNQLRVLSGDQAAKVGSYNKWAGWSIPGFDVGDEFAPLGVEGGIARSRKNMRALADLLRAQGIALTIVVYPWPLQLALGKPDNPQVAIWRQFCSTDCKAFIDLFPTFFAEKEAHEDWYRRLYIVGDVHFSVVGNELVFREVAKRLLSSSP
jgi:hypothetical protein